MKKRTPPRRRQDPELEAAVSRLEDTWAAQAAATPKRQGTGT